MRSVTCALALVAGGFGCSSEPADIGTDRSGKNLSDYAGSWDGYTEAFELEPGSTRIRLVLDEMGQGTVLFGDTLLPPPNDPDIGFPPQFDALGMDDKPASDLSSPVAGFRYPIHEASAEQGRFRFNLKPEDQYVDWCRLQTQTHPGWETCLPNDSITVGGLECPEPMPCCIELGTVGKVDCLKYHLCGVFNPVCSCGASGCDVNPNYRFWHILRFDGVLEAEGSKLVGSLAFPTQHVVVRLTRQ